MGELLKKHVVLLTGITFLSSLASAAPSGTLTLRGTVAVVADIVVTPNGDNLALDIAGGESNKLVASAAETSNNLTGYKIFVSSATDGELRHTTDATKKTTYQVRYAGSSAVSPTASGVQVKNVSSLSGLTTNNSNINVDVDAYATAPAGTYEDTLTITIQSN